MSQQDMLGLVVRKLVNMPLEVLGIVCDFLDKLSNPEWVEATKRFLRKENPWPIFELKVWKTLGPSGFIKAKQYREALKDGGHKVSDYASEGLDKMKIAKSKDEVDFAKMTLKELGFKTEPTYEEICKRIIEGGGELCQSEDGPRLRLEYKDQPKGEWLPIAMEPFTDPGGDSRVFDVERLVDDSCLSTYWFSSADGWNLDREFVFRRPRK